MLAWKKKEMIDSLLFVVADSEGQEAPVRIRPFGQLPSLSSDWNPIQFLQLKSSVTAKNYVTAIPQRWLKFNPSLTTHWNPIETTEIMSNWHKLST